MSLPNCPRIVHGATTWNLTLPCEPWEPEDRLVGGMDRTASGVPVGYVQRTEPLMHTVLRFYESEWPSASAWYRAVAPGASFTFRIDQNDALTVGTYYLESPSIESGGFRPTRDPQYLGAYRLPITVRRTTETVIDFDFLV